MGVSDELGKVQNCEESGRCITSAGEGPWRHGDMIANSCPHELVWSQGSKKSRSVGKRTIL